VSDIVSGDMVCSRRTLPCATEAITPSLSNPSPGNTPGASQSTAEGLPWRSRKLRKQKGRRVLRRHLCLAVDQMMSLGQQVHYLRASTSSHATTWYSTQGMPDTGARRISGDGVITPAT